MSNLDAVRLAIQAGNKPKARQLLKPILKDEPSADAWTYAAMLVDDNKQAIGCLKRALAMDEWHTAANRMLSQLQAVDTSTIQKEIPLQTRPEPTSELEESRRKIRARLILVVILVGLLIVTVLILSMLGLMPSGTVAGAIHFLGGASPVTRIDGIPIEDIADAAVVVPASKSVEADSQTMDILDHGLLHEYRFEAEAGEEITIYVQFFSPNAKNVPGNVVVLDPNGDVPPPEICYVLVEDQLLGGTGNVQINCLIDVSGEWRVRVLGMRAESVGTYFIGVEHLEPL